MENGKVLAVGGLIVAIIGTVATVIGVWLQVRQPQSQPPGPTASITETTTVSGPDTMIDETTAAPSETTPTSEVEITETTEPPSSTSTLQEVFGFAENGNCHDAASNGYAGNDVAVLYCTLPDSPVYLLLHKYAGMSAADYLAQYPSSLEYRSSLDGPDGQLCAERYVNTFTGDDNNTYNSKIVHFLSTPFLVEVNAPADRYSRADIELVPVQINPNLAC